MTTINVRIDEDLKKQASELFAELGLDMSTAINIFLRKAVMYDGLPFDIRRETPNAETIAAMSELEEAKKSYPRYTDMDDLWEALNK